MQCRFYQHRLPLHIQPTVYWIVIWLSHQWGFLFHPICGPHILVDQSQSNQRWFPVPSNVQPSIGGSLIGICMPVLPASTSSTTEHSNNFHAYQFPVVLNCFLSFKRACLMACNSEISFCI